MGLTPLDFYIQFVREMKKCNKCGKELETMEQVKKHSVNQPCRQTSQTEL